MRMRLVDPATGALCVQLALITVGLILRRLRRSRTQTNEDTPSLRSKVRAHAEACHGEIHSIHLLHKRPPPVAISKLI